jgi:hypothetical protein
MLPLDFDAVDSASDSMIAGISAVIVSVKDVGDGHSNMYVCIVVGVVLTCDLVFRPVSPADSGPLLILYTQK